MCLWIRKIALLRAKKCFEKFEVHLLGRVNARGIGAVMNDFFMIMMANDIWGWLRPKFSWDLSYNWAKWHKKTQPWKLTRSRIEPEPAGREATILPLHHSGGLKMKYRIQVLDFVFMVGKVIIYFLCKLISAMVKNMLIFNTCGEFRWRPEAQLAKSILLTSTLVPLGSFKLCSDAKERVGCGK